MRTWEWTSEPVLWNVCVANSDRNEITIRHNAAKPIWNLSFRGTHVMNSTCVRVYVHFVHLAWAKNDLDELEHQSLLNHFTCRHVVCGSCLSIFPSLSAFASLFIFFFSGRSVIYMPFLLFTFAPCTLAWISRISELDISDSFYRRLHSNRTSHHTVQHTHIHEVCQI